jgi:hypothetical protein
MARLRAEAWQQAVFRNAMKNNLKWKQAYSACQLHNAARNRALAGSRYSESIRNPRNHEGLVKFRLGFHIKLNDEHVILPPHRSIHVRIALCQKKFRW